mmetsp:Transcript_25045/g.66619  ORF Transcript_25045/g.66619 Transcript_25045/m.66619 type:complete len:115 (-) Transcript_25045:292-636(-)
MRSPNASLFGLGLATLVSIGMICTVFLTMKTSPSHYELIGSKSNRRVSQHDRLDDMADAASSILEYDNLDALADKELKRLGVKNAIYSSNKGKHPEHTSNYDYVQVSFFFSFTS